MVGSGCYLTAKCLSKAGVTGPLAPLGQSEAGVGHEYTPMNHGSAACSVKVGPINNRALVSRGI